MWRIAESLEVLRRQLNEMFPLRSKVSDGGIGDAAHASRDSDHNPWFKDKRGTGIFSARDFTHDPENGVDCHWLAKQLVDSRDKRIKYIIWNGQILSSQTAPWSWRKYSGKNPHKHHLHLSVTSHPDLYDDQTPWKLDAKTPAPIKKEVQINSVFKQLNVGSKGDPVRKLQQILHTKGFLKSSDIDGDFGRTTRNAVILFQRANGLDDDGIVGVKTAKKIGI